MPCARWGRAGGRGTGRLAARGGRTLQPECQLDAVGIGGANADRGQRAIQGTRDVAGLAQPRPQE